MCKKLMFLISLVCLLGMASSLSADDLEVDWPDVYTVSGVEEYDEITCSGKIIVPDGTTLIMNDESELDGNGDDGEGGDGATIFVDGGTFIMHNRLNMGCDHDAYLIIDNGGIVEHDGDKITVPDNEGGEHRIIILDGSMVAEEIEIIHDRDAKVILGCNATIEVCRIDEDDSRDPDQWLADGDLLCDVSCPGFITVTDLGDNCKEAICFWWPPPPLPRPADGAIHQVVTVDLEWRAGVGAVRHVIYFGTSYDGVLNAGTTDPEWQGYKNIGTELWDLDVDSVPPVYLELWRTYYWRIDAYTPPDLFKGNVWSFTTGCSLVPGDINLDCVVNLLDYAMLADDWRDESFFPGGVVP